MAKTEAAVYEASCGDLWSVLLKVVAEFGYTISVSDERSGVLSFNTGRSLLSWSGQNMTAFVIEVDNGRTRLQLGGSAAGGPTMVSGGQLTTWGERGSITRRVFDQVGMRLATRPCPHCQDPMRRDRPVCPRCGGESDPWVLHGARWWVKRPEGVFYLDPKRGTEWVRYVGS